MNHGQEVSQFICSSSGLTLYIKQNVGLRLPNGLLISHCHSAVIKMEPAAFVNCICCVMPRTNPRAMVNNYGSEVIQATVRATVLWL